MVWAPGSATQTKRKLNICLISYSDIVEIKLSYQLSIVLRCYFFSRKHQDVIVCQLPYVSALIHIISPS